VAIRNARFLRPALALLAVGAAATTLVVAPSVAGAAPHATPSVAGAAPHATPSATDVQKKLGDLALQNTQLVEKYNQARLATAKAKTAAAIAQAASRAAQASYNQARQQYVRVIRSQYESSSLGAAGALLESDSGSDYLQRITSLGVMSTHVSQVVTHIDQVREVADSSASKAATLYAAAKTHSEQVATQRKTITAQIAKYQKLLQQLNSQQRADYLRATTPSVAAKATTHLPKAASGAAQKAVQFALQQVGDPYVFGAAGPNSWDCSGLTMMSWKAAGVSLPHSAADQYNYGHHVSLDNLSPGDLIFMYQPIGHVTIYIGNGLMVSAPTEGEDVTVVPVSSFSGDIVGATHLG